MATRIKTRPEDLRDQMTTAIAGITALGPGWPAAAPTLAATTAARDALATAITDTDTKEAAWRVAAQTKTDKRDLGIPIMRGIDEATDLLYGESGAQKTNFGLEPKGAPMPPLHKLIEIAFTDGPNPGSLKADWESIEGASYEVQWSTTSNFAAIIGSAISASASDYIISGLVPGTQYWMHVRPVRGGDLAEWSDPATRVAPV